MTGYRITHRTTYTYDEPVTDSLGIAHLVPRSLPWQHVGSFAVETSPTASDLSQDVDYYGNTSTYFQVLEPHTRLEIAAVSEVEVTTPLLADALLAVPWEQARPLATPDLFGAWSVADFALESSLVEQIDAAREYALPSFTPGRPLGEAATDLMHRIHTDFDYDHTATTVTSTVSEVLSTRAGVCQDFAHLTLACLRSLGLAGRYISGYLSTLPAPGTERVVGADASHAWAAVWLPDLSGATDGDWLAFDPTNDQWASDRYITVAWGRDYADVPPVKGVIFTEAKRSLLDVSVDVAPL